MAFDLEPGGGPRGACCPKCKRPVTEEQPAARLVFREDPSGWLGFTGLWHGDCSRPYWGKVARVMGRLDGRN